MLTQDLGRQIISQEKVPFGSLGCPTETLEFTSPDGKMKATCRIWENYLTHEESSMLMQEVEKLDKEKVLKPDVVKGTETRRRTVAFSNPGYSYSYHGGNHQGRPLPSWLCPIQTRLETDLKQPFELSLATLYPDGNTSLGAHADDEDEIVRDSIIACLSVGESRNLEFFINRDRVGMRKLPNGSLYTMEGKFQSFLRHAVPQMGAKVGPRTSLHGDT